MKLNCIICSKEFVRHGKQALVAKCCSFKCLGIYNTAPTNCSCAMCERPIHVKPSNLDKKYGNFCSVQCLGRWRSINLKGANNPNFRNAMYNGISRVIWSDTLGRLKIHHAILFEYLGISSIPKGYHTHHRDCNHQNNVVENLVLINGSDHRWLHKQFGNATLWAYYYGKVSIESLIAWSNDKNRAAKLLPLNIIVQKESGIFKSGELREKPEVVNPEPSISLNV